MKSIGSILVTLSLLITLISASPARLDAEVNNKALQERAAVRSPDCDINYTWDASKKLCAINPSFCTKQKLVVFANACVQSCPNNFKVNTLGVCVCSAAKGFALYDANTCTACLVLTTTVVQRTDSLFSRCKCTDSSLAFNALTRSCDSCGSLKFADSNGICIKCDTPGSHQSGTQCVCYSNGKVPVGGSCPACPAGLTRQGSYPCQCIDDNASFDSKTSTCSCSSPYFADQNRVCIKCTTPGTKRSGTGCVCTSNGRPPPLGGSCLK